MVSGNLFFFFIMHTPTVSVAFQIMPKVAASPDAIALIDRAIAIVRQSGVTYEVGPMETTMEGDDLNALFAIVQRAQEACLQGGAESVFINMKVLANPSGIMTMHEKTAKHRL